jgi:NAD(P)-dependent dehydrogenase (short-subunit alcohol dehydrogenase family)
VTARLSGKVALITGASRGIGAAVARRMAREGARVVLCARTVGALEDVDDSIRAAGGAPATLVPFDLNNLDAIDPLGPALLARHGGCDIVVANAAILGTPGPLSHHDPKLWDEVMRVNLTANWRLFRTVEPLLRRAEQGRAIVVTSGAAASPPAYFAAYAASKAGLEAMTRSWAAELAATRVRVNLLDPGIVRTSLRAHAFPGEDPQRLADPALVTDAFVDLALPACGQHGEIVRAYRSAA